MINDYILFSIGSNYYALAVSHIERIDHIPELTSIPNAHPWIDGMMTYQGNTLKVLNFSKMVDSQPHEKAQQKLLIYRNDDEMFAVVVDMISDIIALDESQIKSYRQSVKIGEGLRTKGVFEYKKRLVIAIESISLPEGEE